MFNSQNYTHSSWVFGKLATLPKIQLRRVYTGEGDQHNIEATMRHIILNLKIVEGCLRMVVKMMVISVCVLLGFPQDSQATQMTNIRGSRYCEIIFSESLTQYEVYNTYGLNDCPEHLWKHIRLEQVKKDTGSSFVHLNGPRYWVIDGFTHTTLMNSKPRVLAGLAMREAGVLHFSVMDLVRLKMQSKKHYQQWNVERKTTWVYFQGQPVYELIDPAGQVFVMQSYSIQQSYQTEASLAQLGSKLHLPEGWRFKTGLLTKQQTLKAIHHVAVVVQDDFLNTYQKATHDFL